MITQTPFDIANELLATCTAAQAYTMGAVTVLAARDGLEADRQLLYAASTVPGFDSIDKIYRAWKKRKGVQS